MITPIIGRQVWFRPGLPLTHDFHVIDPSQALAATVIYAHGDRLVNLQVIDHIGKHHFVRDVLLLQDDEYPGPDGDYAEWMPYQKATAGIAPVLVMDVAQIDDKPALFAGRGLEDAAARFLDREYNTASPEYTGPTVTAELATVVDKANSPITKKKAAK